MVQLQTCKYLSIIMSRPEHSAPPEIFYNEAEAEKYTNNTRMMNIQVRFDVHFDRLYILHLQAEMTERALELLCLPDEPCYLLDLGCGSGLSGECIEEQVDFTSFSSNFLLLVLIGSQLGWT